MNKEESFKAILWEVSDSLYLLKMGKKLSFLYPAEYDTVQQEQTKYVQPNSIPNHQIFATSHCVGAKFFMDSGTFCLFI